MEENKSTQETLAGGETAGAAEGQDRGAESAEQEAETQETGQQSDPGGGQTKEAGGTGEEKQDPEGEAGEGKPPAGKPPQEGDDQKAREREIQKREESLARRELELDAKAILKEKGISETMLPFLLRGSKEETEECIAAYKAAADAELKARLDERLVGKTPPQSAGQVTKGDKTISDVFASALRG